MQNNNKKNTVHGLCVSAPVGFGPGEKGEFWCFTGLHLRGWKAWAFISRQTRPPGLFSCNSWLSVTFI